MARYVKDKKNKKQKYRVSYSIDIEASSPLEAAKEAVEIIQQQIEGMGMKDNPEVFPPVFDVVDNNGKKTQIDFLE